MKIKAINNKDSEKDTKKCPFCGEEIKSGAILCKHCKSRLDRKKIGVSSKILIALIAVILLPSTAFGSYKGLKVYQNYEKIKIADTAQTQGDYEGAIKILDSALINNPTQKQKDKILQNKAVFEELKKSKLSYDLGLEQLSKGNCKESRDSFGKVSYKFAKFSDAQDKIKDCNQKIIEPLKTKSIELAKKHKVSWTITSTGKKDTRTTEEIINNLTEKELEEFIAKYENYQAPAPQVICDENKKQEQIKVIEEHIMKLQVGIRNSESMVRQLEAELLQPERYPGSADYTRGQIKSYNQSIVDSTKNIEFRKSDLESIKKCVLMKDDTLKFFK